jgi:hypothetical protein
MDDISITLDVKGADILASWSDKESPTSKY